MKKIMISLPVPLIKTLDKIATKEDISRSLLIRDILKKEVEG